MRYSLEYYQERFRYIMVDEYQDTNTVQFKFISLLAWRYQNLCVVGDDDQSIYKFRGANIRNILGFEKVFTKPAVISMEQNYRSSTANILNAANAVISHNTERKARTLWTENEDGDKIAFRQFDNAFDEAEYIVSDIKKWKRANATIRDNAIFIWYQYAQSRMFEEKFITANIPYKIIGGINFYARREIKDILAYLKTVDNGQDDLAVQRISMYQKEESVLPALIVCRSMLRCMKKEFMNVLRELTLSRISEEACQSSSHL